MYLTPTDLETHLYGEVTKEIERSDTDTTKLEDAISAAIEEARGYLSPYDVAAIFAAEGDDRNPILLLYIKDIAVWHYIQLSNPGVEMELRLQRYEKAIKWFEKVQSGKTNPNLPYPAAPPPGDTNTYIKYGSNPLRNNIF